MFNTESWYPSTSSLQRNLNLIFEFNFQIPPKSGILALLARRHLHALIIGLYVHQAFIIQYNIIFGDSPFDLERRLRF
jgi:hypothetical protein